MVTITREYCNIGIAFCEGRVAGTFCRVSRNTTGGVREHAAVLNKLLAADEVGGVHLEAVGQFAEGGHARLYFVALDPGDRRRGDAGALGQLCLGQRSSKRADTRS
jgi:hypothetical protein